MVCGKDLQIQKLGNTLREDGWNLTLNQKFHCAWERPSEEYGCVYEVVASDELKELWNVSYLVCDIFFVHNSLGPNFKFFKIILEISNCSITLSLWTRMTEDM
jgi:hypothetical protein